MIDEARERLDAMCALEKQDLLTREEIMMHYPIYEFSLFHKDLKKICDMALAYLDTL